MPPYKRQHYLPTAYLKYFAAIQEDSDGGPHVWRFDRKSTRLVPIKSQGWADYHYSKSDALATEQMFSVSELRYRQCVDKLTKGQSLTSRDYGDLLTVMFDFHIRNAAHRNLTGLEGIVAYKKQSRIFLDGVLFSPRSISATHAEIAEHIEQHWNLRILRSIPGTVFLTSDHPSAWLSLKIRPAALHMMLLPITPTRLAFAFDNRFIRFVEHDTPISNADQFTLNVAQIENSVECLYASAALPEAELAEIKSHLEGKPIESPCAVNGESWQLKLQGLLPEHHFSFIQVKPPHF